MEGHLDSGVEYSGNEDLVNAEGDLPNAEGDIANAEGNLANTEGDLPNAEGDIANAEGDLPNAEEDLPNAEEAEIQPAHALPAHAEEANVDLRQHVPLEPDILVVEGPYVKRISPEPRDRQSAVFSLLDARQREHQHAAQQPHDDIWAEPLPVDDPREPQLAEDIFSIPEEFFTVPEEILPVVGISYAIIARGKFTCYAIL
ncbi:hypothetical protein EB796_007230 [Bugula neritina]|uniref:Uncharacterized protein n=1 Tax=Bugula neritina TaxID=10212 RepID=A0A7J7K932_BUGNE|nr:hypothetical protein EB796_007230 [Bugula neritina]